MKRPFAQKRILGPFAQLDKNKQQRLIAKLENAIGDEKTAKSEYDTLIRLLEESGYDNMAEQVREIQQDEIRHRKEFKNMLSEIRRDTV